jgi:hypothetical protein
MCLITPIVHLRKWIMTCRVATFYYLPTKDSPHAAHLTSEALRDLRSLKVCTKILGMLIVPLICMFIEMITNAFDVFEPLGN